MEAFFDILPSTNEYAKQNILKLGHRDIIAARAQSAGRGRKERKWISDTGGLYFSLILKPPYINTNFSGSLTQAMALAVCKTVSDKGIKAYLKWPNDVLFEGKKFCGILSEAIFEGNILVAVIIGVGINIKQTKIESDKPAVTLKQLGLDINEEEFLRQALNNFYFYFDKLSKNGFKSIKKDFKDNFPYIGQQTVIRTGQEEIKGIVEDVDDDGKLVISARTISIGDMDF